MKIFITQTINVINESEVNFNEIKEIIPIFIRAEINFLVGMKFML